MLPAFLIHYICVSDRYSPGLKEDCTAMLRAMLLPDCVRRCAAISLFCIGHEGCLPPSAQPNVKILRRKSNKRD